MQTRNESNLSDKYNYSIVRKLFWWMIFNCLCIRDLVTICQCSADTTLSFDRKCRKYRWHYRNSSFVVSKMFILINVILIRTIYCTCLVCWHIGHFNHVMIAREVVKRATTVICFVKLTHLLHECTNSNGVKQIAKNRYKLSEWLAEFCTPRNTCALKTHLS